MRGKARRRGMPPASNDTTSWPYHNNWIRKIRPIPGRTDHESDRRNQGKTADKYRLIQAYTLPLFDSLPSDRLVTMPPARVSPLNITHSDSPPAGPGDHPRLSSPPRPPRLATGVSRRAATLLQLAASRTCPSRGGSKGGSWSVDRSR